LTVRWAAVRVLLLSWLLCLLLAQLLVLVVGAVLARVSSAPAPAAAAESAESLARFALIVLCALGALLSLLAALPWLRITGPQAGPPLTLSADPEPHPADGRFVMLDFAADTRCRIDLHRFGRSTYDTRQRWQPSPAPDGESAAYVLRYVERPPPPWLRVSLFAALLLPLVLAALWCLRRP